MEQTIYRFATAQWGEPTFDRIGLKLSEEVGEVAGALCKIPEERATFDDADDEVGDVLIVLAQYAHKRGTTLDELRDTRFKFIQKRVAESHPELWEPEPGEPVASDTLET